MPLVLLVSCVGVGGLWDGDGVCPDGIGCGGGRRV